MSNDKKFILFVEGASDIKFFESYINYLNLSVAVNVKDFKFQSIGGSDDKSIINALRSNFGDINSNPISTIGIILDLDDLTRAERHKQINDALIHVFSNEKISVGDNDSYLNINYSENKTIKVVSHLIDEFANVNNLEELLMTLVMTDPIAANCLKSWKDCCDKNNRKITASEFSKFWREVYVRFDYCADKNIKKHAVDNCTVERSYVNMLIPEKPKAWNFDSEYLRPVKTFLTNFIIN